MSVLYAYTILYVDNVHKTIKFYEDAFGFEKKFVTPEGDYAELISGSTTIAFANHELGSSNFKKEYQKSHKGKKAFGIELAFTTENVNEVVDQAIKFGADLFEAVEQKPWGQDVAYIRDNNGFLIEICTPLKS